MVSIGSIVVSLGEVLFGLTIKGMGHFVAVVMIRSVI